MAWPSWEQWLESLDQPTRQRAVELRGLFETIGAHEPEGWARSEVSEDIAQLARFLFLRGLWKSCINVFSEAGLGRDVKAGKRLLEQGADPNDLVLFARAAAYQAVFGVLYRLDDNWDDDLGHLLGDAIDDLPAWRVMETRAEQLTGREVGGLYESLLSMDPSGLEGRDLWA